MATKISLITEYLDEALSEAVNDIYNIHQSSRTVNEALGIIAENIRAGRYSIGD